MCEFDCVICGGLIRMPDVDVQAREIDTEHYTCIWCKLEQQAQADALDEDN